MSSLNSLWIKKEQLQEILKVLEAKDQTGIELTISIDNEPNAYGQNVSAFVSQSKEDREAEKPKYYVGNGRTFWTDGKISVVICWSVQECCCRCACWNGGEFAILNCLFLFVIKCNSCQAMVSQELPF